MPCSSRLRDVVSSSRKTKPGEKTSWRCLGGSLHLASERGDLLRWSFESQASAPLMADALELMLRDA